MGTRTTIPRMYSPRIQRTGATWTWMALAIMSITTATEMGSTTPSTFRRTTLESGWTPTTTQSSTTWTRIVMGTPIRTRWTSTQMTRTSGSILMEMVSATTLTMTATGTAVTIPQTSTCFLTMRTNGGTRMATALGTTPTIS